MLRPRLVVLLLLAIALLTIPLLAPAQSTQNPVAPPSSMANTAQEDAPPAIDPAAQVTPANGAASPADSSTSTPASPPGTAKPAGKKGKKNPPATSAAASAAPIADPNKTTESQAPQAIADESIPASERYRRDLINLLALRTDPALLLAASILARPDDGDPERAHGLRADTLLQRAQAAGPKDALVWWITAFACGNAIQLCPRADALQKLTAIDASNAAVWVLEAQRAQLAGDAAGADAALAHAAAAREYNDYSTELTRTLLLAISDLPVPPVLLQQPPPGVAAGREGIQLTLAYNLAAKLGPGAAPAAAAALQLCDPDGRGAAFAALRKDCLALAAKLEWSASLLAQRAGLALRLKLSGGAVAQAEIANKQRNLAWQQQRSAEIMQGLLGSSDGTRQLQRLTLQSHTESGLVYALLREANVPLEAPLDADAEAPPAAASEQRD